MIEVVRYTQGKAAEWDAFVAQSKNGTFLFFRGYMDYHADRFEDCSLMVYLKNRMIALLPGNRQGTTFFSHQGLTYGGFITDTKATAEHICEAFDAVNSWLRSEGFCKVVYKPMPWIYHRLPAEEDVYALFVRCHAHLIERDVSSTVFLSNKLKFTEARQSGIRKAKRSGCVVHESDDVAAFWDILSENLRQKYAASPVHTASEMRLLKDRFPDHIRLFMVYRDGVPVGGTILYLTPQVVHTQYISASPEGKQCGALDLLFDCLINEMDFQRPYFDFGTSARADSNEVNSSLIFQKQGFGGRGVCYDWYEWILK
jgi:hypothetical protein